jgi:DNA-directed RNA polymerase subunit omega
MTKLYIDPPIDDLLDRSDSKYELCVVAAKRAKDIKLYYQQLQEGSIQVSGPLVDDQDEKNPLTIAFEEINSGVVKSKIVEPPEFDDIEEGNEVEVTVSDEELVAAELA